MDSNNVQVIFFQHLKALMPPHLSMVDEVADLLGISNDSAYRRIRGEKPIDLQEAQKLCTHFKMSLDQMMHLKSDAIIFTGRIKKPTGNLFEDWLRQVEQQFQFVNSFQKRHIYWLMKDIPPFVTFQIPELVAFKCYFWMKSILHYPDMKGLKFSLDDPRYDVYREICLKIVNLMNKVPTTEIWNVESINSTLYQLNYTNESGSFKNPNDVKTLYAKFELLLDHIERQADAGKKFMIGQQPKEESAEYKIFVNQMILGDNTVLVQLDNLRITFLNHSVMYFVGTQDEDFNNSMFDNLENLMSKSTLISSVGERERNQFFNKLREKIYSKQETVS